MSSSHIIFCVGLASNDQQLELTGSMIHHSFQSLIDRLRILGARCVAAILRLEIEELSFEERVRNEAEFMLAKGHFAEVISKCPSDAADRACWIYVLPLE